MVNSQSEAVFANVVEVEPSSIMRASCAIRAPTRGTTGSS